MASSRQPCLLLRQQHCLLNKPYPTPTRAESLNARAVVLSHHGAGMMRELLWGHVTMHCTKFCPKPLLVLEPRHVGKPQWGQKY